MFQPCSTGNHLLQTFTLHVSENHICPTGHFRIHTFQVMGSVLLL